MAMKAAMANIIQTSRMDSCHLRRPFSHFRKFGILEKAASRAPSKRFGVDTRQV